MNFEVHMVNGIEGCESCLILSGSDAVLIDTGYSIGADKTAENIAKHLDGRELLHIILTHSHYDHVMGTPNICDLFPNAKIYAHQNVKKTFSKPKVRKALEELNCAAAKERCVIPEKPRTDELHVDFEIKDGDIINIGEMKIRVIETPGHTKDSISLYFENENLVFASESHGVALDFPAVVPGFVSSYDDTVASINKIKKIDPDYIIMPHSKMISGYETDIYLDNALLEAGKIKNIVLTSYDEGCDVEEITEKLKPIYHTGGFGKYQPYDALHANWIPMIKKLIEQFRQ